MHAFEHHLAPLVVERDGEADDAAVIAFRLDRHDGELRRHGIADESRPFVSRFISEHRHHRLCEFVAERRRAQRAQAKKQKPMRNRRIPAFGPRIIGIVMERVRVALTDRKWDQLTTASNALTDILFYLEE